ncbi:MAG: glutamine--fructose-6-phosphate transaminase (isomerizing) [Rhodospirillaceae bacterium]|nr:glutamine--fructose-6-phosphate transaminase (isomerizing) [Rhodospirillaceae bacterium]
MCGIVGIIGKTEVAPFLLDGLKRLEYRGYDSAGIATLDNGGIQRRRAEGKIVNLEAAVEKCPIHGTTGIGHTRWATHGVPNEANAHPHSDGKVALVHNGIIENFQELRRELMTQGHVFESDTDTEVVVHLISACLSSGLSPKDATFAALKRLKGAFALAILFLGHDGMIIGARKGSPLAIGYGEGEMFLGSDALALAPLTRRIAYLEDGDFVVLSADTVEIFDAHGAAVERDIHITQLSGAMIGKGAYRHFMLKEIYEQATVIGDTLNSHFNPVERTITLPPLPFDLADVKRVTLVACGTSYYASMVGKYWIERFARVPVDLDIASEFRYRASPVDPGSLAVFISQSGETADTLAALRFCKAAGMHTVAIVNAPESTMAREADAVLPTLAGPEIGVASTKAFTTQLIVLACLAIVLGKEKGVLDRDAEAQLSKALTEVPAYATEVLKSDDDIRSIAQSMLDVADVFYLGRGTAYAIAMEGALKLKEISYIHAEGFAAGELKHGPIAMIDETVPVVVIAPPDELFEKTASNVEEVIARGGQVVFISDAEGAARFKGKAFATIVMPSVKTFISPILYAIPVQLLAYHIASLKGTDVDQPRNLAKSVTVE